MAVSAFFLILPFLIFPNNPETALQIILNGAVLGVLYSILALGFSLIFGVAKQLKLSIGGYYVVAAYTMFFLLSSLNIVPRLKINTNGLLSLILFVLPLFLIIGILFFLRTMVDSFEFKLILVSPIICGGGVILYGILKDDSIWFMESFYSALVIASLCIAAWYLELNKRQVAIFTFIIGILIPVLLFLELPLIYISLMIITVLFTSCLAMVSDRFLLDNFRKSQVNILIVTFALALLIQSIVQLFYFPIKSGKEYEVFGPKFRVLQSIVPKTDNVFIPLDLAIFVFKIIVPIVLIFLTIILIISFSIEPKKGVNQKEFIKEEVTKDTFAKIKVIAIIIIIITIISAFILFWLTKMDLAQRIISDYENVEVTIATIKVVTFIFSIIAITLMYFFIWRTRMGMALRAVSQDEEAAALAGINIRKTTAVVSGVGISLIAFASVLTSPYAAHPFWSPYMGWWVLIMAIAIVTLGGMGSLSGSIIAAFIIGYAGTIISSIESSFSVALPFIVVVLVMVLRPEGILGRKKELESTIGIH
ncbi:MAG: branched-chain amino acid ABC transporter permease [Candidatus Hodarchaeales archaeon]|jgi:branched-subunit amino acid ABC-type transport system permease component